MSTRVAALAAGVAGLLLSAGAALAQQAPLSGPTVTQNRPDFDDRFSGTEDSGRAARKEPMGNRPVPMRAYMDAVMKLGDQPAELHLTSDQQQKINSIVQDFRTAMRSAAPKRAADDATPPAQNQPNPAEAGKGQRPGKGAREALRQAAPIVADYETRIYAVLTLPQQKFVDGEVQKVRADMEQRAGEEYMKRQLNKKAKPGEPGAASPPDAAQRERAARIIERLRQLPPDQRDQVLQLLEKELDRRGVPQAEPRDRGVEKPAPTTDEIPVPTTKKDG